MIAHDRRAALDGLGRILDAGAPEDLFAGPEDEAFFLHQLLVDAARARRARCYWEICRTARRRGVTPEYVVDRAVVLLGTINERRRTDLYRILGIPPLASGEAIRQHWREVAKVLHPDAGGDAARFQVAKQAYEVLRDPARRAEYERFWLRTLGPFERVALHDDVPALDASHPLLGTWMRAGAQAAGRTAPEADVPAAGAPTDAVAAPDSLGELFARARALLAPVSAEELEALRTRVARAIEQLETARGELETLATLKARLRVS